MIEYLALIFALPIGIILSRVTKDEKVIFSKAPYFPVLLWILAITSAIFYTLNKTIALPLTFIFLTTFIWNRF
ncbi:hypothetical protein KAS08_06115 [Candidatus Pacearchaeota archaeon]|nr:hypothetical protein [Candidatus Pacearchaeota archaeon]